MTLLAEVHLLHIYSVTDYIHMKNTCENMKKKEMTRNNWLEEENKISVLINISSEKI